MHSLDVDFYINTYCKRSTNDGVNQINIRDPRYFPLNFINIEFCKKVSKWFVISKVGATSAISEPNTLMY